jgi:pilus assembly protein Flp/PilA
MDQRTQMKTLFSHFANDESGATAIEYGLIAAGIAVAIIAAVQGLGSSLSNSYNFLAGKIDSYSK